MTLREKLRPIVAQHGIYSVLTALIAVMQDEAKEHHKRRDYEHEELAKKIAANIEQARDSE